MKKLICILTAASLLFLCSCSGKSSSDPASPEKGSEEITSEQTTTLPAVEGTAEDMNLPISSEIPSYFKDAINDNAWNNDAKTCKEEVIITDNECFEHNDEFHNSELCYYDYTDSGLGILFYGIPDTYIMNQFYASISVTDDAGKTWKDLGTLHMLAGDTHVRICEDKSIYITSSDTAYFQPVIKVSTDFGKTFTEYESTELFPNLSDNDFENSDLRPLCKTGGEKDIILGWEKDGDCFLIAKFPENINSREILYINK